MLLFRLLLFLTYWCVSVSLSLTVSISKVPVVCVSSTEASIDASDIIDSWDVPDATLSRLGMDASIVVAVVKAFAVICLICAAGVVIVVISPLLDGTTFACGFGGEGVRLVDGGMPIMLTILWDVVFVFSGVVKESVPLTCLFGGVLLQSGLRPWNSLHTVQRAMCML